MEGKQNPSTTDDMSLKKYVFLSLCLRIICLLLNHNDIVFQDRESKGTIIYFVDTMTERHIFNDIFLKTKWGNIRR